MYEIRIGTYKIIISAREYGVLRQLIKEHDANGFRDGETRVDGGILSEVGISYPRTNPAAVTLGSIKSPRKAKSSRENGKKGGRPKKPQTRS